MRSDGSELPTDRTFTGQRAEDFGLLDYNARYYDPALGRFISADTLVPEPGSPLAWDRYAYVFNNPVNLVDPDGHRPCDEAYCPGEVYDPERIRDGASWYGEWDTKKQAKRSEAIEEVVVGGGEFIGSMLWEPVDWALTINDCIGGQCSALALLGFLPLIPGSKIDDIVDAVKRMDRIKLPVDEALELASKFLGKDCIDLGKGRFASADGLRQVRMDYPDINGDHAGGPHINFELLGPNPAKPGSFTQIFPTIHIFLEGS